MQTDKQVIINIDDPHRPSPFSTLPDWNNFWLIPSHSPHLREFVISVEWNCAKHLLKIDMMETPTFSAFNWFGRFESIWQELGNDEVIAICFFAEEGHDEVARLEFKGLAIQDHKCVLDHDENDEDRGLIHELTLKYNEVKKVDPNTSSTFGTFEVPDSEWQEEKEPILMSDEEVLEAFNKGEFKEISKPEVVHSHPPNKKT